jgi:hypothetical protein
VTALDSFSVHWAAGSPSRECLPNERDGSERLIHDELMRQAQDAKPLATLASITPGIRSDAFGVITAIDFDDQSNRRREEINDVVADDDLATKLNAELFTTEV